MLERVAAGLARIRAERPLVHHLTNEVTVNDQANITLSIGASPMMASHPVELDEVLAEAGSLVLNIGTITPARTTIILEAAGLAKTKNIPVVLDPVGAGTSTLRKELTRQLLECGQVDIIKGNCAEMEAVLGLPTRAKGVDSNQPVRDLPVLARQMSERYQITTVITAETDVISDGTSLLGVKNGDGMLQQLTGSGCMLASLIACFRAVQPDNFLAAVSGTLVMGLAGQLAAEKAAGPASLRVHLLDEVYRLGREQFKRANLKLFSDLSP